MASNDQRLKRDHQEVDMSPTGTTPPATRPRVDTGDFTGILLTALGDPRVVEALNCILVQPLARQLEAKDEQIKELTDEVTSLKSEVDDLKNAVDELEQYGRRNALRVWSKNMPERPGEDTDQLILDYAEQVGVNFPPGAIGRSHRVGKQRPGKIRPIIVKFATYNMRKKLFDARKNSQHVFVSEDLTRIRSSILYKARLERNFGRFKHCWSSDGRINVRLPDDSKHVITTLSQLDRLIDETPLPGPN